MLVTARANSRMSSLVAWRLKDWEPALAYNAYFLHA